MLEHSFREFGAGRAIVADRQGRIVAGNKSRDAAVKAGIQKSGLLRLTEPN
jgi:hypothetical protein